MEVAPGAHQVLQPALLVLRLAAVGVAAVHPDVAIQLVGPRGGRIRLARCAALLPGILLVRRAPADHVAPKLRLEHRLAPPLRSQGIPGCNSGSGVKAASCEIASASNLPVRLPIPDAIMNMICEQDLVHHE